MEKIFISGKRGVICLMLCLFLGACSDMIEDQKGNAVVIVLNLATAINSEEITLTWDEYASAAIDHMEVTWSPDGLTPQTVATGTETITASSLKNGTAYSFTVRSLDSGGTVTSETVITATPVIPGAPANAVYIYTAAELDDVRNNLLDCYILMADIDLSGYTNWVPIGQAGSSFRGTLDGNGHVISNLTITGISNYRGLFGYIYGGTVMNLGIIGCSVTGSMGVGSLAGGIAQGTITNCYSVGTVSGSGDYVGGLSGASGGTIINCYSIVTVNGSSYAGGLVGYNSGTITNCYSTGSVTSTGPDVGGIVGVNYGGTITGCYSTCSVTSTGPYVGGLVGSNVNAAITNCYSTGDASGSERVGGLAGSNQGTITNCYSTGDAGGSDYVGGLVGIHFGGSITYSYYSGSPVAGSGSYKTTGWNDSNTFINWNFTTIWALDSTGTVNNGYPYLRDNQP